MPDLVSLLQSIDTSIGYEAADEVIDLRQRLAESELEREDLRSQLNHIHMSMPLVDTHPAFAGDIPLYVKSVVANLQDKALAYDLDQAGITTRDAEAVELVSLRAEVAHMRSQTKRAIQVVSESVARWRLMKNDEITRVLKKHGRADVPTYLKELAFLRGLLAEAYKELSTIEAATLIPGGQSEIDGLLDLVQRIEKEIR